MPRKERGEGLSFCLKACGLGHSEMQDIGTIGTGRDRAICPQVRSFQTIRDRLLHPFRVLALRLHQAFEILRSP
jgi:hypothetical protein